MAAQQGQGGGIEQRRYVRVPINLEGLIGLHGRAPVPCTVRDFCAGGMFISVDPAAYAGLPPNANAMLFFALFVDGVKQDFQVRLSVARAVASGLGVSFVEPDQRALELLGALAAAHAPAPAPETASELGRTQQGFAPEFAGLIEPLKALCGQHVRQLCERFLERVDQVLFLAARDAGNNVDQNRYLDGQREVRGRQKRVREAVPAQIETGVAILRNPASETEQDAKALGLSDLALVDKDEFEEFLVISEMVSELEPEFSEPLLAVGRRLSYLANREVDLASNPVSPGALCNAVAECLKGLQSDRRVTARVYKVLHEVMSANLGRFYEELNALLVARGILPVIEKDKPVLKKRPASSFDAPAPEPEQVAPVEQSDEDLLNLMPGPENYQGRNVAPATRAGAPASLSAAPPTLSEGAFPTGAPQPPPGFGVPAQAVLSAAPSLPPGYAPAPPAGGMIQGAPPSLPPGYAPAGVAPGFAPGSVAPAGMPAVPAGAYLAAAPPSVPAGYQVASAAPSLPPGMVAGDAAAGAAGAGLPGAPMVGAAMVDVSATGSYGGMYALPAGWVSSGARGVLPSMQQGYSAAQTQLALRRQLVPDGGIDLSESLRQRGDYSRTQILQGLSELQSAFVAQSAPPLLDVEAIKQRITEALLGDGAPRKLIAGEAADAIEVVANLFSALLHDALIAKSAKRHLTRLQPSVHKAAMLDAEFFASTAHPVRQMVDRIAQLRDGKGEPFEQRDQRIQDLVDRANAQFHEDVDVFQPLLAELDGILGEQRAEYDERVRGVVASCEQQQRVLDERRGGNQELGDTLSERAADLPEEWNRWLERSRALAVGQQALMNANSANPNLVTLVWKEQRSQIFVFVDEIGNKASTLTLQQVAMYLRRGVLRVLDSEAEEPPLERAMLGVVDQLHSQVEEQATRDPLTGFLARRFFIEAIDAALAAGESGGAKHAACCQVSIENLKQINEQFGVETGDGLLKACADALQGALRAKGLVYGRLSGSELGVFWPSGGVQIAQKRLQAAITALKGVALVLDDSEPAGDSTLDMGLQSLSSAATVVSAIHADFVIGLTGSDDAVVQAESLLGAARDACETARGQGTGTLHVAGSESEQRRALEQMVAYAGRALERDRLVLLAQSVTSLNDGELPPALHVVVTARDRNDRTIPHHLFGPALTRSRAAADIDLWGFRQTLAWMLAHEEEVERYAMVIVPLSPASMKSEQLPQQIMGEFMEIPVPPGKICFEIPDRDVVANLAETGDLITTLRDFGCRFLLDEFGSGHANYDYIKRLEVDYVTIKSSFLLDAQKNPKDFAMAKSINELVHFMGKKTVAKQERGVDLAPTMREIGVDFLYDLAEQAQLLP
ncbi:MAG: DUF1631 family protein [Gammaproteobacteria bacterium]|nr:DUF1631 family protein [Gammaproteobacteria bacterium]